MTMINLYEEQSHRWVARMSALKLAYDGGNEYAYGHPQNPDVDVMDDSIVTPIYEETELYVWKCEFPDHPELKPVWVFND